MQSRRQAFVRSSLLFIVAFVLTNLVNSAFTLAFQSIVLLPPADAIGQTWLNDPAYQATVPWHALIALIIFTVTALWLDHRAASAGYAWRVGLAWAAAAMLIDAIVYVGILGSTRWGLPPLDFYIGNQPWITLTYLGLLLAPGIARQLRRRTRSGRTSLVLADE